MNQTKLLNSAQAALMPRKFEKSQLKQLKRKPISHKKPM